MNYKVSVIIPCYNAESTIERAINSVINQTLGFENIELLLYDDASTDGTSKIIEDFSKKHDNIIPIFSKVNNGPGIGRTACMKKASSEFLMFMDSDDEYDVDMCKNLYNTIISTNSELVACSYICMYESSTQKAVCNYVSEKAKIENNMLIFSPPNIFCFENIFLWICIFRKDIVIKNEIFPQTPVAEDVYFSQVYMLYVNKLVYLKDYFGLYKHIEDNSISNSYNIESLINIHNLEIDLFNVLEENNAPVKFIFRNYVECLLYCFYISNTAWDDSKKDIFDFFTKLRIFVKERGVGGYSGKLLFLPVFCVMHGLYNFTFFYLKLLNIAHKSEFLLKIYRNF
jgi:glycosyltransferase involved in cell wall biosynthesis